MKNEACVVLVKLENGKQEVHTRQIYLKMRRAGRKVALIRGIKHLSDF
jgi:hypothetical protein